MSAGCIAGGQACPGSVHTFRSQTQMVTNFPESLSVSVHMQTSQELHSLHSFLICSMQLFDVLFYCLACISFRL